MMIAAISANAQNEVGQITLQPKAGINLSTITGDGDQKMKNADQGRNSTFSITVGYKFAL